MLGDDEHSHYFTDCEMKNNYLMLSWSRMFLLILVAEFLRIITVGVTELAHVSFILVFGLNWVMAMMVIQHAAVLVVLF